MNTYDYTVRRGDSFYLIAHRLGLPLRDLLDANPDVNPARLKVGDVLRIRQNVLDSKALREMKEAVKSEEGKKTNP